MRLSITMSNLYCDLPNYALVQNDAKLVITFINLTCNIELKINVSWNNTPLDNSVRVIILLVYQQEGCYLETQIPENIEGFMNWYCIIEQNSFIPYVLTRGIELYLETQIPENIEGFMN